MTAPQIEKFRTIFAGMGFTNAGLLSDSDIEREAMDRFINPLRAGTSREETERLLRAFESLPLTTDN